MWTIWIIHFFINNILTFHLYRLVVNKFYYKSKQIIIFFHFYTINENQLEVV